MAVKAAITNPDPATRAGLLDQIDRAAMADGSAAHFTAQMMGYRNAADAADNSPDPAVRLLFTRGFHPNGAA